MVFPCCVDAFDAADSCPWAFMQLHGSTPSFILGTWSRASAAALQRWQTESSDAYAEGRIGRMMAKKVK